MPQSASDFLNQIHSTQHQSMVMNALSNMGTPGGAEGLAGAFMSRGRAIGGPLLSAATGMMGLDPMSLAMKAGMGAWNRGVGVAGSAAIGMGTMGLASAAGTAAHFVGDQMYTGAAQQMQLNSALRSNFNFVNQQGGMGFTTQQGNQIGGFMRGMTHEFGQAGEVSTFGELSRLAANMGRMGMGQDVKTVKDFKEKFKTMVDTLKTVAHDMGSSLEEAQKFVQSMKGSGIFNKADQLRMSGGTRMTALAGGLAMSEVTGAANIGSQISRSIGGLGRQGAFAGMNTIGQIGMAQRVGAISEEDIYNATGLTGAEGRQQLAAAQMQQSASFLSTGRGRRFLASVAGKNGTLNEGAVSEWMAGGMSTGRTVELGSENLGKVGRANFIRNEGRLRGAALEKFGGSLQSMAYSQWLSSRGFDPNNIDDRSMLAFQRFTGMGRDEADLAIKQVQALPEIAMQMQETQRATSYNDAIQKRNATTGISGLKRKFEQTREGVQGKLQDMGAKLLAWGENQVASYFNSVMGIYETTATEGLAEIERGIKMGGQGAKDQYRRYFGGAGKAIMGTGGGLDVGMGKHSAAQLKNQSLQFAAIAGTGDRDVISFGEKNKELIQKITLGGMGRGSAGTIEAFREELMSMAGKSPEAAKMAKAFAGATEGQQVAMLQTLQEGAGVGRENLMYNQLKQEAPGAYMPKGGYRTAQDKYLAMGNLLSTGSESGPQFQASDTTRNIAGAGLAGLGLLNPALGLLNTANIIGRGAEWVGEKIGGSAGYAISKVAGILTKPMDMVSGFFEENTSGSRERRMAMGQMLEEREYMSTMSDLYGGSESQKAAAKSNLLSQIEKIRSTDKSSAGKGRVELLASSYLGAVHGEELNKYMAGDKTANLGSLVRDYGNITGATIINPEDIIRGIRISQTVAQDKMNQQQLENLKSSQQRINEEVKYERSRIVNMGIAEVDKDGKIVLSAKGKEAEASLGSAGGALRMTVSLANFDASGKHIPDSKMQEYFKDELGGVSFNSLTEDQQNMYRQKAAHKAYFDDQAALGKEISGYTSDQLKGLASKGAGTLAGELAGRQIQMTRRFESLSKGKGGEVGAIAKLMGLNVSDEELERITKGKDTNTAISALLNSKGLGGDKDLQKELQGALAGKGAGEKAFGISAAIQNMSDPSRKKLQEAAAAEQDPSYRTLMDIREQSKRTNDLLKIVASSTEKGAAATEALSKEKGEGKGQQPGGT